MKTAIRFGILLTALASPALAAETSGTTHKQAAAIPVKGPTGTSLQTLCLNADGQILALVAPPRGYGNAVKNVTSEVQVLTGEGKKVTSWKVNFHGQSINCGPDGTVYVAGDGRVAKFDKDGKPLAELELPHIAALLKDKDGMRKQAEEQIKSQKESFQRTVKQFTERKEKLEAKQEADLTDQEKRQLKQYEQILKSYEQTTKYYESLNVDTVLAQTTGRLRVINSIAATGKDVFIVCGEGKGYGYAVWRMNHEFKDAKQIMSGLSGCCGQMDVQVSGGDLLVAENTQHRFGRYDRDGKQIGTGGKRGKETEPGCFGGCCNPMNLRSGPDGDVFTAESEGIVKRFSAKGEFLGNVGHVALTGGCKNVSVAVSPTADRVYFCDLPGSRVIVLALQTPDKK